MAQLLLVEDDAAIRTALVRALSVADAQGFIGSTAAETSTAYAIQQWVAKTFTARTVGGATVFELS